MQGVGQRQRSRALERVSFEAGAQAVARHPQAPRSAQVLVDLLDLNCCQKLALIDEEFINAVQSLRAVKDSFPVKQLEDHTAGPWKSPSQPRAVIERTGEHQNLLANRQQVVTALQQRCAFSTLHRGVVEIEHLVASCSWVGGHTIPAWSNAQQRSCSAILDALSLYEQLQRR